MCGGWEDKKGRNVGWLDSKMGNELCPHVLTYVFTGPTTMHSLGTECDRYYNKSTKEKKKRTEKLLPKRGQ